MSISNDSGYILNSSSEKYLNAYLRKIEKLCVPGSGYLQNFQMYFKLACNIYETKFNLDDVKYRQEKVIVEVSQELFRLLKNAENKHYDATIYALITLSASYVCDRLLEKAGMKTYVLPGYLSANEKGEVRSLQNLKRIHGLPRNENEIDWTT